MITLEQVHNEYGRHFKMDDLDHMRLDCVLATLISIKKPTTTRLWLINVGASGWLKSGLLNPLMRWGGVHVEHSITPNTIVSGNPKAKDLAPQLNNKVLVIPDLAQLLTLAQVQKAQVWAQLRDLYDGNAGRSTGAGKRSRYNNLNVGLIGNATFSIDQQILIHSNLGTRELIFRGPLKEDDDSDALIDQCFKNENHEQQIIKDIQLIAEPFLHNLEPNFNASKEELDDLKPIIERTRKLRTDVPYDYYNREITGAVVPEKPTRIAMQFKRMYEMLRALDKEFSHERAIEIIKHIGNSSVNPTRIKVLEHLTKNPIEHTTSSISLAVGLGKATITRECLALEQLKFISNAGFEGNQNNWRLK